MGKHRICADEVWEGASEILGDDTFDSSRLAGIPWAMVFRIASNAEDGLSWHARYGEHALDVEQAMKRILRNWLSEVHRHHNGQSPISFETLNHSVLTDLAFHLDARSYSRVSMERAALMDEFDHDLWLMIGMEPFSYMHPLGLELYLHSDDAAVGDHRSGLDFLLENRPARYMEIIEAALAEGYDELANAYLAFGVFSQAMTGFSVVGWPKRRLSDLIARSVHTPGDRMVRKALEVASVGFAREGCKATHACLASHSKVTDAGQATGQMRIRPVGWTRSEIEEKWKSDLGTECWLWLFPKTKNYLIDAEIMYSRCHIDLGTGIVDYGGLTSNYCKALESELVERYRAVFIADEYHSYKAIKNLKGPETLGSAVHLITHYDRLPADLQHAIRSQRLLTHEDSEIVRWLRFCADVRNKAAHPSEFKNADFLETREVSTKIYKRLMSRMI
jgi:hypothetical protein